MGWRGAVLSLIGALALLVSTPVVQACTLDDVDGSLSRDTLNHYYPDALDVLARVVDARRAAGLPPSPGLTPTPVHVQRLMVLTSQFDRGMRAAVGETRTPPVALLLIESMLWARLPASPSKAAAQLHATGPAEGDLVVVTSEDTVRQVVAGNETWVQAKARGLLRLYGRQADQDALLAAVTRAAAVQ